MKKILFLIHDLGYGGAEKVLINLVNNMDSSEFDITVMTLFDWSINRQFLNPGIKYRTWCKKMLPGNSHIMKLFSTRQLHRMIIKEHYDIEIAYLEGPCARVISGCPDKDTKLISWIHCEQHTAKKATASFRNIKEAEDCYNKFDKIVCVSETVKKDFTEVLNIQVPATVLYNTNESAKILNLAEEPVEDVQFKPNVINLIGVGKLLMSKGFNRLARIEKRLLEEGYLVHVYILGIGPEHDALMRFVKENNMIDNFTLLGYQTNPYKYVSSCDLFICASYSEGFSTAATEALIVGTPVCTVEVSGMKEMLGENNEYGVVTDNDDEALYLGIKRLLDNPELLAYYKRQAELRGKDFSTGETVLMVEELFQNL